MELASTTAAIYGLDTELFIKVIQCESGFNPGIVGDNGTSFGIAQLHNPSSDWFIATSTALDPTQALQIMGQAWKDGKERKWSCYRKYVDNQLQK